MKNTRYAVVAVAAALTLAGCTAASATGASEAATTVTTYRQLIWLNGAGTVALR